MLIAALLAATPAPTDAPRVAVAFDTAGQQVRVAEGLADPVAARPVTADDPVRIASVSKLGVALVAARLVDAGELNLDRDASRYLGWTLRHPAHPRRVITLRMLLSHTSGLVDGVDYALPLDTDLARHLANPAAWKVGRGPGRWFEYANLNYPVAAAVLEGASGVRFDRLAMQHFVRPLGLSACYNWQGCDAAAMARAVTLRYADGTVARDAPANVPPACPAIPASDGTCDLARYTLARNGAQFSPQGGLRISAADLARVGRMWLAGGGTYLSRRTLADLARPVWRWNGRAGDASNGDTLDGFFCAFGSGIQTIAARGRAAGCRDDLFGDGRARIGHAGEAYGLRSGLWIDLSAERGAAFFATMVPDHDPGARSAFTAAEEALADSTRPISGGSSPN